MPKGTRRMVFKCNTCIIQKAVNICIFLNKILYRNLTCNEELWSVLLQLIKNKATKNGFRPSSLKTVQSALQFNKIFKRIIWTTWPILIISGQNIYIFFLVRCLRVFFYQFLIFKSISRFLQGEADMASVSVNSTSRSDSNWGDLYLLLRIQFLKHCRKTFLKTNIWNLTF